MRPLLLAGFAIATPGLAADTKQYHYDAAGRLISSDRRALGSTGVRNVYHHDRTSNRTQVLSTGAYKPLQLGAGMELKPGEAVLSNDKRFLFVFQNDGNLVVYQGDLVPIWSPQTQGSGAVRAVMQHDGNFVLYRADGSTAWSTGTSGLGGNRLVMQDDGNLVMYPSSGPAVWSTGTCCR